MAHTLQIGNTSSDPKVVNKNYSFSITANVNIKEGCSVINPIFILDYQPAYAQCNYAYLGSWGRFYYIDNMIMQPGGKCELHCTVDPLTSFANSIRTLSCSIVRKENRDDKYLIDDQFKFESGVWVQNFAFGDNLFGSAGGVQYVIGVIGSSSVQLTSYQLLTSKPADWDTNWEHYYTRIEGEYVSMSTFRATYKPDPDNPAVIDFGGMMAESGVYEYFGSNT